MNTSDTKQRLEEKSSEVRRKIKGRVGEVQKER